MILPEVGVNDLHNTLMEQSELIGVEPSQLLSALSKIFESMRLDQGEIDSLRISRGQALVSSTPVRSYAQSQELARTIGLERTELQGVGLAERRIERGLKAAQVLMETQDLTAQQPNLQIVAQTEAQVA